MKAFDDGVVVIEVVLVRVLAVVVELAFEYIQFDSVKRPGGLIFVVPARSAFCGWDQGNEIQFAEPR